MAALRISPEGRFVYAADPFPTRVFGRFRTFREGLLSGSERIQIVNPKGAVNQRAREFWGELRPRRQTESATDEIENSLASTDST